MENNIVINRVHQVFNGVLNVGTLRSTPRGRHSDAFVYFSDGELSYKFGDRELHASHEDIIYLPRGSVYEMTITKRAKYICVDFDFDGSENKKEPEVFKNLPSTVPNEFMKLFYNRYRVEPWCAEETFSSLYKIYALALRAKYKSYSKSSKKTTEAIKYIIENYSDKALSISEISKKFGYFC